MSNDCRASALDLCPCSLLILAVNIGPLPGGLVLPLAPRLAGVSLWYNADTLVCQGRGGGHAALIISATPRGRWPWAPRTAGGAGGALHCPASPPLRQEGEKEDRPGLQSVREDQGGAGRQAMGGPLLCPLSLETCRQTSPPTHTDTLISTDSRWCGGGVNSACRGPSPGSVAHKDTEQFTWPQGASVSSPVKRV